MAGHPSAIINISTLAKSEHDKGQVIIVCTATEDSLLWFTVNSSVAYILLNLLAYKKRKI